MKLQNELSRALVRECFRDLSVDFVLLERCLSAKDYAVSGYRFVLLLSTLKSAFERTERDLLARSDSASLEKLGRLRLFMSQAKSLRETTSVAEWERA